MTAERPATAMYLKRGSFFMGMNSCLDLRYWGMRRPGRSVRLRAPREYLRGNIGRGCNPGPPPGVRRRALIRGKRGHLEDEPLARGDPHPLDLEPARGPEHLARRGADRLLVGPDLLGGVAVDQRAGRRVGVGKDL